MHRKPGEQTESSRKRAEADPGTQREESDSGSRRGPTRLGFALTAGLVVITAVIAAPQFVLSPVVLVATVLLGTAVGVAGALLSHYRQPSRTSLVLAIPLVFFAIHGLQESTGIAEHTVLVGISAVVVGGTVTDILVTSR